MDTTLPPLEKIIVECTDRYGNKKIIEHECSKPKPDPSPVNLLLRPQTALQCIEESRNKPEPETLLGQLWHEGELAVMFGDAGAGKSLVAVQAADAISRADSNKGYITCSTPKKVLYVDLDTGDKLFEKRYSRADGTTLPFSDNFLRSSLDVSAINIKTFADDFFGGLESTIKEQEVKVLIIDSLDSLKFFIREGEIVRRIRQLQLQYGLSVLLVAGTRRPTGGKRLSMANLNGMRSLAGLADSIFGIGIAGEEHKRYFIQLKSRTVGRVYHQNNVVMCELVNDEGYFSILPTGSATETQMLTPPMDTEEEAIIHLKQDIPHLSLSEIARSLDTYKMKVKRTLDKYRHLLPPPVETPVNTAVTGVTEDE